jgi:hypothetical protein
MSKESFKIFAKSHPELVNYIKNNDMTWQKFYEIYDIYGEDNAAWSPYLSKNKTSINSFQDIIGSINTESIQKHINTAQKAIGVVQELAGKGKSAEGITNLTKGPINPRPINKFFED